MIADDNKDLCLCLSNSFTKEEDIKIVNISTNGLQALTYYTELNPDVLLLDLNMPGLSGIDVLNYLNKLENKDFKKNVIVLSSDFDMIQTIYNQPKIYSYFSKPFNYSQILDSINAIQSNSNIENNIENLLWKLGFNIFTKETGYLKDSIKLAYTNSNYIYNNKELMRKVARLNKINEKAVRSNIDKSLNRLSIPIELNSFFYDNYDGGRPSLKIFIAECVNYLKSYY